jgi:pseudo-rSAM protein
MKNIKGCWLFFDPYVHVSLKKTSVFLYNTINGECIKVIEPELIKLVYTTQHCLNQGVVFLNYALYKQTSVFQFINEIREKYIGDIIDVALLPEKPIQFIPIPNLSKGTIKPKSSLEDLINEDIFSYYHFLNLQINNQCGLSCKDCSFSYKQNFNCFAYRLSENRTSNNEMPFAQIETICQQIKTIPLHRINITGGNIFLHTKFQDILELFDDLKLICSFGVHYLNFPDESMLKKLQGYRLEIFTNPPYQVDKIESIINLLKKQNTDYLLRFRLISECDYDLFNTSLTPILEENTYITEPLYTGKNRNFFEKNVFINESDIFEEPVPQRTIFANSILNSNFFGHLYIDCNGDVKSNPNNKALLGNISTNTFYQLIANELVNNYAWKKTRTKSPCNKCLYQFLCPPPSNYEYALKRNNLCHVV